MIICQYKRYLGRLEYCPPPWVCEGVCGDGVSVIGDHSLQECGEVPVRYSYESE